MNRRPPKLFVAIGVPIDVAAELVRLQPRPMPGLRLTEPAQMHVTLHYFGEADMDRAASALEGVATPALALAFDDVGQFPSAGGTVTLWVGVRKSDELTALHAAIGAALVEQGFQLEARPYAPHVTLARCSPEAPATVVDNFLLRHQTGSFPVVPVSEFGLYSSTLFGDSPMYRRERSFSLRRQASNPRSS